MPQPFSFGAERLDTKTALQIALGERSGFLHEFVKSRIREAARQIAAIAASDSASYGINTGFGPLCATIIPKDQRALLQRKLLISHSVGIGDPIDPLLVRLMLVLKIHGLAQGHSGVGLEVVERLLWMLETGWCPLIPAQGSVGASGDLAPLAHMCLPLLGEGMLQRYHEVDGRPKAGLPKASSEVLREVGLEPLVLGPKDGLGLINGTQFIAAHAVLCVERLGRCLEHSTLIAAMMLEGLQGSHRPFDERLHALRPHAGATWVASRMREHLRGSEIAAAHEFCDRVQDPYSLRCIPQVHGASYDAWHHLRSVLEVEINSVTDNPVLVAEEEVVSGGSFHGQPLALPLDYACLAASELGSIAERRIYLSLLGIHPNVPKLLMSEAGLDSGFMIVQYTAAALASENKSLCLPASADSIPTGMGQEDHVSMGAHGSRKCLQVVKNLERIQAIELLCAAQALDFQRPLRSGEAVEALHEHVRSRIGYAKEDRVFGLDIQVCVELLRES